MKTIVYDLSEKNRIDKFLCEALPEYTRSFFQKLIKDEKCLVNGKVIKTNYVCSRGDQIELSLPESLETELILLPEAIPLDIIFEDEDLIVINKPRAMVVHPAPGHTSGTLVNALLYHFKGQLSDLNGDFRPGIVHRIDKDTTGLILVAKNNATHQWASEQLKEHKIIRRYEAIVHNSLKEEVGTVSGYLARSQFDRKRMAVSSDGKWAVTHYRLLEKLKQGSYAYISCQLETGRTHQIRVHMASIGNPIVGDKVYGPKKSNFNLEGQLLHARELHFTHPKTGQQMHFEADLPADFKNILTALKKYDKLKRESEMEAAAK